jgi:hypothetical protein
MGILIIITGLVFLVLVFGSWGVATTEADGVQSAGQTALEEAPYVQSSSEPKITEDIPSEIQVSEEVAPEVRTSENLNSDFLSSEVVTGLGPDDVSVAQECDYADFDVEAGKIVVCDYNLPESLPTCITNLWLSDYYIKVCVYGGYHPVMGLSTINLAQEKEPPVDGDIHIMWTSEGTDCPCGAVCWTAHFCVSKPIVLASNHVPDVCIGDCEVVGGPEDMGKWVTASLSSVWAGCDGEGQLFTITGSETCIDVDPGKIIYWADNIPGELPVCITNSWLQDKWLMLAVWGGYHPCSDLTTISLIQDKSGLGGDLAVSWTPIPVGGPCGAVLWKAEFSLVGDPIVLEANKAPDEILGPDGEPIEGLYVTPNDDLGKLVSASITSTWAGCGEADQQFVLIPAHKSFVPEFPTLDERYIASSNIAVRMTSLQA